MVSSPSFGDGSAKEIYRMIDVYEQDFKKWWTDSYAPADYWHNCAGTQTQRFVRDEIMADWANRWQWLKE